MSEEAIIDAGRPLVDPHHHLWARREAGASAADPYLAADFLTDVDCGHRVVATVAVEAVSGYRTQGPPELAPVGETEFLVAQAAALSELSRAPRLAGIVGYADLRLGERVGDVLDAHLDAGKGLFRGVRQMAAYDPQGPRYGFIPPGVYGDPSFCAGLRELGERGLTFDAWHFHSQQPEFVALARACPQTTFVLDHFGTPLGVGGYADRAAEVMAAWRKDMRETASLPNVFVKASGFLMGATGLWRAGVAATSDQVAAIAEPWFDGLIEIFGPERCMFASNFPVERTCVRYAVLWNAFKKLAARLPAAGVDALCRATAARAYRLEGIPEQ